MPLTLDIRDVLRSCRLGPVALGHTRREVHDLLGPPDRWSDAPHMFSRKASIWLYGPLELHFAADPAEDMRLHLIWCDYLPFLETRMNPQGSLRLEPWGRSPPRSPSWRAR